MKLSIYKRNIEDIEQTLRQHYPNFDDLLPSQKLCLFLSQSSSAYGAGEYEQPAIDYLEKLYAQGADVDYVDEYGKTPFDITKDEFNGTNALWLIEKGAAGFRDLSPNQKLCFLLSKNLNPHGNTIFGELVTKYMEILLVQGANLDHVDEYGKTPFDIAVGHSNPTSIMWLIEHGANGFQVLTQNQKLCLLLATFPSHNFEISQKYMQHVDNLLQQGAQIDYVDEYGKTPLDIIVERGHIDTALVIAEKGAILSAAAKAFFTQQLVNSVLHTPHSVEFCQKLIKHGADISSLENYSGDFVEKLKLVGEHGDAA